MKHPLLLFLAGVLLATHCFAAPPALTERSRAYDRELPVARAIPVDPPAANGAISSTVRIDDNYVLRPGDRVSYAVLEDRKAPLELVVQASGELEVPGIGRFRAANMTCRDVAANLKAELERSFYKKATVTIALNQSGAAPLQNTANIRVYFMGAIRTQGAKEFPPDGTITVSRAILIAGGFGEFADQKKVQLIRRQRDGTNQITTVNVGDLLKGKPGVDPIVQAEDMIRVPERLINF
jgi:protein involved in polysaccharide export with SLBB domain